MMRHAGPTGCGPDVRRPRQPTRLISISSAGGGFSRCHSRLGNPPWLSFWADSSASATFRGGKEAKQRLRWEGGGFPLSWPRDAAWAEGPGRDPNAVQGPAVGQLDSRLSKSCLSNNCILQLKAHRSSVHAKLLGQRDGRSETDTESDTLVGGRKM